jgi:hypothetical protein
MSFEETGRRKGMPSAFPSRPDNSEIDFLKMRPPVGDSIADCLEKAIPDN